MQVEMEALVEALIKDLNSNYKTIGEMSREMAYPSSVYLIRKVKQLGIGHKVKQQILLSPKEQEILKNSIQRREKKEI